MWEDWWVIGVMAVGGGEIVEWATSELKWVDGDRGVWRHGGSVGAGELRVAVE